MSDACKFDGPAHNFLPLPVPFKRGKYTGYARAVCSKCGEYR